MQFLVRLQRLLHEGSFVATYKFALLLALADVCVESGDDTGDTMTVATSALAERFIRYYWRQVVPYVTAGAAAHDGVLLQNTATQAAIVIAVQRAHDAHGGSLTRLRADAPAWASLRSFVATTIEKMPLWKLQRVGSNTLDFLYPNVGAGHAIALRPGIAFCFRRFHELVEDLVCAARTRFVRELPANGKKLGQTTDLGTFLFGSARGDLGVHRDILIEVQAGTCFYCDRPLRDEGQVDHFIPWSRYPVDLGHNFVLAHKGCNSSKGSRLAAVPHLERWCGRNAERGQQLTQAFDARGVTSNVVTSQRITQWAYAQDEVAEARVWLAERDELVALAPTWHGLLDAVA